MPVQTVYVDPAPGPIQDLSQRLADLEGDEGSTLVIGTTATTAAAGNHNHAITANAASGLAAAANLQAAFQALSARIKALEDAAT